MSYRSRIYNHRNAKSAETEASKPFFAKQHETNDKNKKSAFFQAKLAVNEPGDQYEHEADTVANAVVNNKSAKPVAMQKRISSVQRLATSMEDEKLGTNDARMERAKDYPEKEKDKMVQKMGMPEKEKDKMVQKMGMPEKEKDKMVQKMGMPEKEKDKMVQKMGMPEKEKDKMVQKMGMPEKEKDKMVQKMGMPEKEKDKMVQKMGMPEKEKDKMVQKMGMPEKEKDKMVQKMHAPEKEEDKNMTAAHVQRKADGGGSTASPQVSSKIESSAGKGNKLPAKTMHEMNSSFGADFRDVRVHHDHEAEHLNNELNAHAFTHGKDIYFNQGKFNPENAEGKHLLAHELTHVVQQQDEIKRDMVQRNLAQSMPTSNGVFGIDMQTQALPNRTGLTGTIDFMPDQTAPYSNEISLIQIARPTDPATGKVLSAVSTSGIPGGNALVTEDNPFSGVEGGFSTDVVHNQAGAQQDMPLSPRYRFNSLNLTGGAGSCFGGNPQTPGFKRSNDSSDIHEAKLADCPAVQDNTSNVDFKFETVAKGTDSDVIYGSLHWQFKARAGAVIDEQATAISNQSATFNESLARHQDFYTHEPVTFYFDFDHDNLDAGEQAKLNKEVTDYLKRFPDVRITISAFADNKGGAAYNVDLATKRANAVAQLFVMSGATTADKINPFKIGGSTTQFTTDAITDQDKDANRKGNRRVTVEFEHTATVPLPGQTL